MSGYRCRGKRLQCDRAAKPIFSSSRSVGYNSAVGINSGEFFGGRAAKQMFSYIYIYNIYIASTVVVLLLRASG